MDDEREIRERIHKLDPMSSGVETRSVTDESSRQMLEAIMDQPISGSNNQSGRRMQWFLGAAAVAAVALGSFAIFGGGTDSPPLQLALGESDAMQSCIVLSADILADMPVAFEGTATGVDGEVVTLSVDEWFTDGTATSVELTAPAGFQALIGGIDFAVGTKYLIAATDGTVNYCGASDVSSPALRALYEEAFAG